MLLHIYLWDPTFTPKLGHNYEHAGTTVQLPTAALLFSVLPEVHKDPSFSTSLPTPTIFCFVLCISFCDYLMLVMWMFLYTLLAICTSVEKHLKPCACFFFNRVVWVLLLSLGILFIFWIFIRCYIYDMVIFSLILWVFFPTVIVQTCFLNFVTWLE